MSPIQGSATLINLLLATGPFTYPQGFVLLGPVISLILLTLTTFIAYISATFIIESISVASLKQPDESSEQTEFNSYKDTD